MLLYTDSQLLLWHWGSSIPVVRTLSSVTGLYTVFRYTRIPLKQPLTGSCAVHTQQTHTQPLKRSYNVHVDEKCRRKEERSEYKQQSKATQHTKGSHFSKRKMSCLGRVGLEPTTLYTLDRAIYHLSYRGSSAGGA